MTLEVPQTLRSLHFLSFFKLYQSEPPIGGVLKKKRNFNYKRRLLKQKSDRE